MRILLLVAAVFIVPLVAVVVVGASLPKHHVASRSACYRATPEQLFALISGPQSWRPDVQRSEPVSDGTGKNLLRETTRDGRTITYEVLDQTPPHSMTRRIATTGLPYSGSWAFTLQPCSTGTLVRITEDGEVYNPVFRFLSRFVFGYTRTMDEYLHALGKATGQQVDIKD